MVNIDFTIFHLPPFILKYWYYKRQQCYTEIKQYNFFNSFSETSTFYNNYSIKICIIM